MPTITGEKRSGVGRIRSRKGSPVYEETIIFTVRADSKTQSRIDILSTTGLPKPGYIYGIAACTTLTATRLDDNPLYWDVVADLSSEVEEGQLIESVELEQSPEVWIPIYETKFERYQEVVTRDFSGAAVANSAGQAYETGITITRHIPIWEFYQFEPATVTDEQIADRSETVNSATFLGRGAKTLLCVVLSSVVGLYYGKRLRLTQYQLKYNRRDWRHRRLDVGTQYKSGTTLLDFTSSDGSIMLGSLDGSGGKQAAGTAPAIRTFDQYATNTFDFIRI